MDKEEVQIEFESMTFMHEKQSRIRYGWEDSQIEDYIDTYAEEPRGD